MSLRIENSIGQKPLDALVNHTQRRRQNTATTGGSGTCRPCRARSESAS